MLNSESVSTKELQMTLFSQVGTSKKSTFYVATRTRYVLIDAKTESEARREGRVKLQWLYTEEGLPNASTIEIQTLRAATSDEIELWNSHCQNLNREGQGLN
jgi:hypothetical protein